MENIGIRLFATDDTSQAFVSARRGLEGFEQAGRAAQGSLDKVGVSAAQTAAAMRQVPAQFTDIVVSLQSGQAPLTVLLQQGGQLKDAFGGVGNAAKALGGYVASLVNPYTLAAGAAVALTAAYYSGAKETENYNKALILSGNIAGTTASQMQAAAQRLSSVTGSQGKAAEAIAAIAQSGAVGAAGLERLTDAALRFERVGGGAIDETVKSFVELRKAPLEASLKLNESMNYLTSSVYSQIKALQEQGRTTEAADLAQNVFADTLKNRSSEMEKNLGLIERGWLNVKAAVSGAVSSIAGIGRSETAQEQLKQVQSDRANLEQVAARNTDPVRAARLSNLIEARKAVEVSLQEQIRLETRSAALVAEQAGTVKLQAAYEKEQEQYKTKTQRREEEIARVQREGAVLVAAGLRTQKQLEQDIANIREKYKDAPAAKAARFVDPAAQESLRTYTTALDQLEAIQSKASGSAESLSKSQVVLRDVMASPQWAQFNRRKQEEIILAAAGAQAAEDAAASNKALLKAQADLDNARDAQLKRAGEEVVAIEARAQALEDEVAAYGMGKQAVESMTIARLEERKATLQLFDGSAAVVAMLEQEIAARQRLAAAQDALTGKEAADKAAKKVVETTERTAERIDDLIANSLMRGFERGMDVAEATVTTLENMFKTLVLRPTISFFTQPLAAALAGASGSSAMAGQGGGSTVAQVTDLINGASQSQSFINLLNGKMADSLASYVATAGKWLTQNTSGVLQQAGSKLYAYSGTIGTAGAYLGGAAAGYGIGTAISGGRSAFGDGNQDVATLGGTALGAIFLGPVGAAIGGAIGGVINRAFGQGAKEINASGITGTFQGSSFNGMSYQEWSRSAGWFNSGSSGTDYSALDSGYANSLGKVYGQLTASTAELADALNLPTSQILGYVKSIRLDSSQLNDAGLKSLFEGIADELASTVVSAEYIRQNERASASLTRLVTSLTTVNAAFELLDKTAVTASLVGGDSASQLIDLLGGAEAFNASTLSYYQAFYTEAERNAKTTQQLVDQFTGLGIAMPDTLEAYRALVNAQDITTESGRNTYAALISLSGAFATVTKSAAEAADALIKSVNYATYAEYASAKAAAGGIAVPRFANGGMHSGGWRIVGEEQAELELTGPARILNNRQIGAAVMEASSGTSSELATLRAEQRAQAASMAALTSRLVKIFDRWDIDGMPEVRTV